MTPLIQKMRETKSNFLKILGTNKNNFLIIQI